MTAKLTKRRIEELNSHFDLVNRNFMRWFESDMKFTANLRELDKRICKIEHYLLLKKRKKK